MSGRNTRCALAGLSVLLYIAGAVAYLVLREPTLVIHGWGDSIGMGPMLTEWRHSAMSVALLKTGWVRFSLPYAVWVLASILAMEGVWFQSSCRLRVLWASVVPLLAVAIELAQLTPAVRGTFDIVDLATIVGAAFIGLSMALLAGTHWDERKASDA